MQMIAMEDEKSKQGKRDPQRQKDVWSRRVIERDWTSRTLAMEAKWMKLLMIIAQEYDIFSVWCEAKAKSRNIMLTQSKIVTDRFISRG